jgi:hypothetical protein
MEQNFDLDINNYTPNDLLSFFKLDENYTFDDLSTREIAIINEVTKANSKYATKYKFDIVNFIKSAKEILISLKHELETNNEIAINTNKIASSTINKGRDESVGKIINPFYTHPALERNINPPRSIDGYSYSTTTSVYVFNTAARNDFFTTLPASCAFDLPLNWSDVIQLSLTSANIPNVMYAFNNESGTNQIYIEEDGTGLSGVVTIPEGNYVPYTIKGLLEVLPITNASFPDVLTKYINNTLGTGDRFLVTFNPSNYSMTISNTTNSFTIHTIIKEPPVVCNAYSKAFNSNNTNINITDKTKLDNLTYVQTMGYLMGYREIYYSGQKSYTGESIFNNVYSNYLYFVLDDFTGSQTTSNTYGILGQGVLSQGILGVIPISTGVYTTTFDNNSNYIYKKREYFGPVNISRIAIKILNQKGNLVNFHGTDFSFAIQVKTIYNLSQKSSPNLRNSTVF